MKNWKRKIRSNHADTAPALRASSTPSNTCLLYTSDAADERSSVDLGGRRIIKKKKQYDMYQLATSQQQKRAQSSRGKDTSKEKDTDEDMKQ